MIKCNEINLPQRARPQSARTSSASPCNPFAPLSQRGIRAAREPGRTPAVPNLDRHLGRNTATQQI